MHVSEAQRQTILAYAQSKGRQWRRAVRTLWEKGVASDQTEAVLMNLKALGDAWLTNYDPTKKDWVETTTKVVKSQTDGCMDPIMNRPRTNTLAADIQKLINLPTSRPRLHVPETPPSLEAIVEECTQLVRSWVQLVHQLKQIDNQQACVAWRGGSSAVDYAVRLARELGIEAQMKAAIEPHRQELEAEGGVL